MADRYERQIQERGASGAVMQNTATPASYGFGIAQSVSGLGEQAQVTANILSAYKEKQDKIDLVAATNDYNRRMTAYQFDPDNGQQVIRKLNDARGLVMDTEKHADEIRKDITSRLSKEAAAMFQVSETSLRQSYINSAAKHEITERDLFSKASSESALQGFLDSVRSDPQNDEIFESVADLGSVIIADNMPGASEEMINSAVSSWESKLETARISMFLNSDPLTAKAMIDRSKYLSAGDKVTLEAKVQPEVDRVEVQNIVDEIGSKFGWDDIVSVSKYVRENYEGIREDHIMTRYKVISNEMKIAAHNADEFTAKQQRENYENDFYIPYVMNQLPIPVDMLDSHLRSGRIGMTQREAGLRYNATVATRSSISESIKRRNPAAWNSMEQLQKEEAIMKAAGITADRRQNALVYIQNAIVDPDIPFNTKDIDAYHQAMLITTAEAKNYKEILSKTTSEFNNVIGSQISRMKTDIDMLFPAGTFYKAETNKVYTDEARNMFMNATYEAQEMGLKGEALYKYLNKERVSILGEIAVKAAREAMGFVNKDEFLSNVIGTMERIEMEPITSKAPPFRVDDVRLYGGYQDVGIPTNGSYVMSMVKGAKYISSDYNDLRDSGARRHDAIDIAAAEGSEIYLGDFGTPMTVTDVGSGTNGGNFVTLSGTMAGIGKVDTTFRHLQTLSGLRKGDTYNSGDLIAFVGNTGKASTGPHLHIEVMVNGKRVNPETYFSEIADMRRKEQEISAATANTTISDKEVAAKNIAVPRVQSPKKAEQMPNQADNFNPGGIVIGQDSKGNPMTLEELERKAWEGFLNGK